MKVLKFGGTSVGSAASIRNVKNIVTGIEGERLLVLSAMSGVTNHLVQISDHFRNNQITEATRLIEEIKYKHLKLVEDLLPNDNSRIKEQVNRLFEQFTDILRQESSENAEARILTFGESVSTYIVSEYFEAEGINNTLLEAKKFMQVPNLENPDTDRVGRLLDQYLKTKPTAQVYITQGFVRTDKFNRINTLKRGGSDFTATILGAAVNAEEIQIWTDIDGFHNNDPRYVEHTHPLSHLSFEEAAELAYFGAKILHPQTVSPVIDRNIPIYLKNTFTPEAQGTMISNQVKSRGLKAISAKDGITAIKIKSNRMLMAHGFLKRIFEVFDTHETAIDMITTSEIAISLTIDENRNLEAILENLKAYGEITVETDHSIICVVGEGLIEENNTARLFEVLQDIPVRMISYGGSINNVSLLVATENKVKTLRALHTKLFKIPSHAAMA
ncbi:aspartate kinase [Antarcticibacterium flavum]|uniref:Aspartokinase n=1 Tax=Antarcticibacterium flavum TaxID=2058175 RepID=A0A5B7X0S3_9FLAO|nr:MULTISPECIES: aspartate kinase [Antarcticibacterium]MCM4158939.1 aspartate kinase [Antarcticibacterium sp. W02-3]QCY68193.1 aspartate kinase [Antarcticibacterium flavum]